MGESWPLKRIQSFLVGNLSPNDSYWTLRLWLVRGLGLIYLNAFLILYFQGVALWGRNGLLPISSFASAVEDHFGGVSSAFFNLPSIFYFLSQDSTLKIFPLLGIFLSVILIAGFANTAILVVLWFLQLSYVNSGQLFYGYGWETQILELTFLCFFLVPLWKGNLKDTHYPPARIFIWAIRWELFRLMLGAGLIKLRGDPCWRDLTCLVYHYETQPVPNPLSFFYYHLPEFFQKAGVVFNHFVEIVVPFGFFGPQKIRKIAGFMAALFQVILISSGNLAWLNWLTLLMCLVCFDDAFLGRFMGPVLPKSFSNSGRTRGFLLALFTGLLLFLSINPFLNLMSSEQAMNTSYNSLHLINSYGAFGSIGRERDEVVIEGSNNLNDESSWQEYAFRCAPGDVTRRPCWISPYHYHLDWQIWFSAMRPQLEEPWLLRLAVRLLENDRAITSLFDKNPFPRQGPKYVRMLLYKYEFSSLSEWPKHWWKRALIREYLPPISLESPLTEGFRRVDNAK